MSVNELFRRLTGKRITASLVTLVLASACMHGQSTHGISSPFDAVEAESLMVDGTNRVYGNARINFKEGGTITCAGRQVFLIPATRYARERMQVVFEGGEVVLYPRVGESGQLHFTPDDPEYARLRKVAVCDPDGNFEFASLADGDFFVGTTVDWLVSGSVHSALFARQIRLADGVNQQVSFTYQLYRHAYDARLPQH